MKQLYKAPGVPVEAGTPSFNEHGVPWHACAGWRADEHYWAWVAHTLSGNVVVTDVQGDSDGDN